MKASVTAEGEERRRSSVQGTASVPLANPNPIMSVVIRVRVRVIQEVQARYLFFEFSLAL